jgi:hypothetical protein
MSRVKRVEDIFGKNPAHALAVAEPLACGCDSLSGFSVGSAGIPGTDVPCPKCIPLKNRILQSSNVFRMG